MARKFLNERSLSMKKIFSMLFAVFACALIAGTDIPLNGDFKGSSEKNIPGWSLLSGAVKPIYDGDGDYAVELTGAAELVSAQYPVTGSQLELQAEVRGSGIGKISYYIYDRSGKKLAVPADGIRFSAQSRKSKVRALLNIPAEAARIAISLTAAQGSTIIFEDVEAEFERPRPVIAGTDGTVPLVNERRYRMKDLENVTYSVTLAPGKDVEFKLEETELAKWQLVSADKNCRVAIDHDRDGIWPLLRYDAEVEIDAVRRGKGEVILRHVSGKEMKIAVQVK